MFARISGILTMISGIFARTTQIFMGASNSPGTSYDSSWAYGTCGQHGPVQQLASFLQTARN